MREPVRFALLPQGARFRLWIWDDGGLEVKRRAYGGVTLQKRGASAFVVDHWSKTEIGATRAVELNELCVDTG